MFRSPIISLYFFIGLCPGLLLLFFEQLQLRSLRQDIVARFEQTLKTSYHSIEKTFQDIETTLFQKLKLISQKELPVLSSHSPTKFKEALFLFLDTIPLNERESIQIFDSHGNLLAWRGWGVSLDILQVAQDSSQSFLSTDLNRTTLVALFPEVHSEQKFWFVGGYLLETRYPIHTNFLGSWSLFKTLQSQSTLNLEFSWETPKGYPLRNQFQAPLLYVDFFPPKTLDEWKYFQDQEEKLIHAFFMRGYLFWLAFGGSFLFFLLWFRRNQFQKHSRLLLLFFLWILREIWAELLKDTPLFDPTLYARPILSFFSLADSLGDLSLTIFALCWSWYEIRSWNVTSAEKKRWLLLGPLGIAWGYLVYVGLVRSLVYDSTLYFFNPMDFVPEGSVLLAKSILGLATLLFWSIALAAMQNACRTFRYYIPSSQIIVFFWMDLLSLLGYFGVLYGLEIVWSETIHLFFLLFLVVGNLLLWIPYEKYSRIFWIVWGLSGLCFSYQLLYFHLEEKWNIRLKQQTLEMKASFADRVQSLMESEFQEIPSVLPELSWETLPIQELLWQLKQLKAEYQLALHTAWETFLGNPVLISQFPNDWFPAPILLETPSKKVETRLGKKDIYFLVLTKRFLNPKNEPLGWLTLSVPLISLQTLFEGVTTSVLAPTFEKKLVQHLRLAWIYLGLLGVFMVAGYLSAPYSLSKVQFNFTHRVLFSFLGLSLIPLIFLSHYQRSAALRARRASLEDQVDRMTRIALKKMQKEGYIENLSRLDSLNPYQALQANSFLSTAVCRDFHHITGYGLNIYKQGHLLASNRPEYFEMQFFSKWMNPKAYVALVLQKKSFFFAEEFLGEASYVVGYRPLLDSQNNIQGVLSIPLTLEKQSFLQSQVALYWRLIYIYAGLMLLLTVIATFLARHLTEPIRLLLKGTRRLSEGDLNYKIPQALKGEFGELIVSFNQMTQALRESQEKLVIAEKNAAWREMAKQIAHEIKNPLTPMKLSAQHIYYAYQDKAEDFGSILEKGITAIIQQIDTLSKIATEFSNFAKFPTRRLSAIDPLKILKHCEDLYQQTEKIQMFFQAPRELPKMIADEDEIHRVFINLIRNAIQAMPNGGEIHISAKVVQRTKGEFIEFRIKDTGPGIPPEHLSKLFQPNFSTKTDGTGLGLAICKKAIEACRGEIQVSSVSGQGAEFIFWIPTQPSAPKKS